MLIIPSRGYSCTPVAALGAAFVAPGSTNRYWRINVTDIAAAGTVPIITELQFHIGANGFGADQAEGGTPAADSESTGGAGEWLATNCFDDALLHVATNSWASANTGFPHWVSYDFGSTKTITGVSILAPSSAGSHNTSAPGDFEIQSSSDNASWTTVWSVTGATFNPYEFKQFPSTSASSYTGSPHGSHQHWRLRPLIDDGGTISSASEIEMRATPSGSDQCSGGSAIEDGHTSTFVAANAFDNNNSTFYASTTTADTTYIGYSFAAPVAVAEFTWRNRGDTAANQAPQVVVIEHAESSSGPWTIAWSVTGWTGWSLGQTRTSTDPNYI